MGNSGGRMAGKGEDRREWQEVAEYGGHQGKEMEKEKEKAIEKVKEKERALGTAQREVAGSSSGLVVEGEGDGWEEGMSFWPVEGGRGRTRDVEGVALAGAGSVLAGGAGPANAPAPRLSSGEGGGGGGGTRNQSPGSSEVKNRMAARHRATVGLGREESLLVQEVEGAVWEQQGKWRGGRGEGNGSKEEDQVRRPRKGEGERLGDEEELGGASQGDSPGDAAAAAVAAAAAAAAASAAAAPMPEENCAEARPSMGRGGLEKGQRGTAAGGGRASMEHALLDEPCAHAGRVGRGRGSLVRGMSEEKHAEEGVSARRHLSSGPRTSTDPRALGIDQAKEEAVLVAKGGDVGLTNASLDLAGGGPTDGNEDLDGGGGGGLGEGDVGGAPAMAASLAGELPPDFVEEVEAGGEGRSRRRRSADGAAVGDPGVRGSDGVLLVVEEVVRRGPGVGEEGAARANSGDGGEGGGGGGDGAGDAGVDAAGSQDGSGDPSGKRGSGGGRRGSHGDGDSGRLEGGQAGGGGVGAAAGVVSAMEEAGAGSDGSMAGGHGGPGLQTRDAVNPAVVTDAAAAASAGRNEGTVVEAAGDTRTQALGGNGAKAGEGQAFVDPQAGQTFESEGGGTRALEMDVPLIGESAYVGGVEVAVQDDGQVPVSAEGDIGATAGDGAVPGPAAAAVAVAAALPRSVAAMTWQELRAAVAGLVVFGFAGHRINDHARRLIQAGAGGVILFARNYENPRQVAELCADLKRAATPRPLLIMVDQEGGRVSRMGPPFSHIPPARTIGITRDPDMALLAGGVLGRELRAVHIDVDLAPVVDVDTNPANPVIGARSFGSSPSLVSEMGAAVVRGIQREGVAACVKHFPGHGDTSIDSHLALPLSLHPLDRLKRVELPPFAAAVDADVAAVLTAHVAVPALYSQEDKCASWRDITLPNPPSKEKSPPKKPPKEVKLPVPASLSSGAMRYLREFLKFDGVVLTDCLEMGAIVKHWTVPRAAVLALRAGVDVVLVCHTEERQVGAIDALAAAVNSGELPWERVQTARGHVADLASAFFRPPPPPDDPLECELWEDKMTVIGCKEHRDIVDEINQMTAECVLDDENHSSFFQRGLEL